MSNEVLIVRSWVHNAWAPVLGDEHSVSINSNVNPKAYNLFVSAAPKTLSYLHNHPSLNNFSLQDIITFYENEQIKHLGVVTNLGDTHLLIKTEKYDAKVVVNLLSSIYNNYNRGKITHNEAVKQFLKSCKLGGVAYEK